MTQISPVIQMIGKLLALFEYQIFGIPFYVLIIAPFVLTAIAKFIHGRK